MAKKALAQRASTAVATTAIDFSAHAGAGLENVTARNLLIPRLTILQSNSPQLDPSDAEFIKGAKVGDIADVGTKEVFEAPLPVLPVHFVMQWLEWAPRNSGRGLVAIHDSDDILDKTERDDKNRAVLENGNYIAETAQFFLLNLAARGRPSFLPMTSTQLKKSRRWLTWANGERIAREDGSEYIPPLFYRVYNLTTVQEQNAEGKWYGWEVERGGTLNEQKDAKNLFDAAIKFRESLVSGKVRGDLSSLKQEEAAAPDRDRM